MRNEALDLFAINFIENHFYEIDLKECEWDVKTKEQAIAEIKEKDDMSSWVITEIMLWGTPIDYLNEHIVENDENRFIIKVGEKYFGFAPNRNYLSEVFPQKVLIEKFCFSDKHVLSAVLY